MKNRLIKIWSIVLTISILAGLLVAATPAAAGTLAWTAEATPSGTGNVLIASSGPWIMEGAPDGKTFFAYNGVSLYKSTDGGLTFSANTTTPGLTGTIIAMAVSPDFANDKVVVAANDTTVFYSVNGGSSFTAVGTPGGTISSVDVSPYWTGNIGILAGTSTGAFLAIASTGGFAGAFTNVNALTGGGTLATPVLGVSFSPNHRTDAMMFFASTNGSNVVVSNKFANTAINGQFGAATLTGASTTAVTFAFPADFDREGNNRFFVGLAGASGEVYRVGVGVGASTATDLNASGDTTIATDVKSLSFKGNVADGYLYVGLANIASVRRATATTAATVSFTASTRLSGSSDTVVFASPASGDTNVYAMTSGAGAAFQVSTDNAATFNLLSLIFASTTSPAILSLAMVDANTRYMILDISASKVLFKTTNAGTNWQGIYWPPSGTITNVYLSPAYATDNTLFVTSDASTVVRRSNNAGTSFATLLNANLTATSAFAVVDANTFFVGATGSIYKSGATTAVAVDGTVTSLVAIDANTIVAGTSTGKVYLSTNGGTSYTAIGTATTALGSSATATYVVPDVAYATNKILYAANGAGIFTWTVDTSTAWTAIPGAPVTDVKGFMQGSEGTIYASTDSGVKRSIDSYAVIPAFGSTATLAPAKVVKVLATGTPTAPANTLYVVTNNNALRAFSDTLVVAPATTAPAANASVSRNTVFSWAAIPVPAGYTVQYQVQYTDAANQAIGIWTDTLTPTAGMTSAMATTPLVPGGKYAWRVKATALNVAGAAGSPFTMASKTSAPVSFGVKLTEETTPQLSIGLLAPGPAATDVATKPTFQWSPVTGATGYDLQVSDNPVFVNPIDSQTNLATNVWTLTKTLDNNKVYYWRVRAVNGNTGVVGDWVQQAFTTAPVPPTPTTAPPASTVTNTVTQTVQAPTPIITVTVPPGEQAPAPATPAYIWVIIAIGAILVIAVIVLIARTRRV